MSTSLPDENPSRVAQREIADPRVRDRAFLRQLRFLAGRPGSAHFDGGKPLLAPPTANGAGPVAEAIARSRRLSSREYRQDGAEPGRHSLVMQRGDIMAIHNAVCFRFTNEVVAELRSSSDDPHSGASKNSPLMTAFAPAIRVTLMTTFPLTFHCR